MGVGFGDLRFGDLGSVDGDGQWRMDVGWREERLVLGVKVNWLESWRGLAVGVIYHWVALVVVPCSCVWMMEETKGRGVKADTLNDYIGDEKLRQ